MFVSSQGAIDESNPTLHSAPNSAPAKAPVAKVHCSRCQLHDWFEPYGAEKSNVDCMDNITFSRRRIKSGESLYREGEAFGFLFEVRSGTLKSTLSTAPGLERVSAFYMAGELIGLDGVANGYHSSSATALEDTEVCAASYEQLTKLTQGNSSLQHTLMQHLGRESLRELHLQVRLGCMSSDERLAAFLLDLSDRFSSRGYSRTDFRMRMSRTEIGSYLGLTVETVCRKFSEFQKLGLLEVDLRHVRIANLAGLARICDAQKSARVRRNCEMATTLSGAVRPLPGRLRPTADQNRSNHSGRGKVPKASPACDC